MKLKVGNVNINNHDMLRLAAAKAGYASSVELVNETTRVIDLGGIAHQESAGITSADIESMLGILVRSGFSVQLI